MEAIRRCCLPISLLLALCAAAAAQGPPFRFQHLTAEDGLSQGSVSAALQDRRGFMWFGTQEGLNRYDGYTVKVYHHDPDDPGSLRAGPINALLEDRHGMLWIGYKSSGLSRFDPLTETFTHYRHEGGDPRSLSHNQVRVLLEDGEGTLWAGTFDGVLNRFDPATGTFAHRSIAPQANGMPVVWSLLEDTRGALWVGTWDGLFRYDRATDTLTHFRPAPVDQTAQGANWVQALHEDPQGRLWVGAWGLHRFDRSTETFERFYPVPDADTPVFYGINQTLALAEDHAGTLWVGTATGLYQFDRERQRFTWLPHGPPEEQGLERAVLRIMQDRQGVLWVVGAGIAWTDRAAQSVERISLDPSKLGGPGGATRGMHLDRDSVLWAGTDEGVLHRFDRRTGTSTRYGSDPTDPRGLAPGQIFAVHRDREGRLWVGGDGLHRLDEATGRFTRYLHDPDDRLYGYGNSVAVIHEDRTGRLWVGALFDGLYLFHPEEETFTRIGHDPNGTASLGSDQIRALYEDHAGRFWVGTTGGLYRLDQPLANLPTDLGALTFTSFRHVPGDAHSLSHDKIAAVSERPQEPGVLWVATAGGGLNRLDVRTGRATHYTAHNSALPSNHVFSVLDDTNGRLWMSTNGGLLRFDPDTEVFTLIQRGETALLGWHRGYNGELFFDGAGGVHVVRPGEIKANDIPPQVTLTGLRLFDEPVHPRPDGPLREPLAVADEIRLSHRQNDLTFEYVGLHFTRPEENRYAYRLEGYEESWRHVGAQRTATYMNLPPGAYTFHVKAASADGVWNEEGASVRLVVVPPWWERAWFHVLVLLGLLGLAAAGYRWRVRYLTARTRELEDVVDHRTRELVAEKEKTEAQARRLAELDEAKSRFFANVSHEFRTPLTLLLSPLDEALDGSYGTLPVPMHRQVRVMRRNARRLLRLVNQLLDLSKLESGRMELERRPGDLVPFLRELVRSFTPLAERRRVTLRFQPHAESLVFAFDRDALEKVVSNLLSNALKFTPEAGRAWITTATDGDAVEIVVKDTGAGILPGELERIFDRFQQVDGSATRAHEGTGLGLALARELVELHGGTLRVESEPGSGSAFVARLPLDIPEEMPDEPPEPEGAAIGDDTRAGDGAALLEHAVLAIEDAGGDDTGQETGDRPAVLIVEDNPDMRALLRDILGADYRVLEASDGSAGWEDVQRHRPALVVSDVMMPRMDGFELCRRIKTDESFHTTPVVLLTAKAAERDRIQGLEGGADDYVAKPFSKRELLVRVTNLILSRQRLRRQFSREVLVKPSDVVISSEQAVLLEQVLEVLETHLGDSTFSVDRLADEIGMSRRQAFRRIKAVTGETPAGLLRRMRLERAVQLLEAHPGTVAEVAYTVGFRSPSHFASAFRKTYGITPSEYVVTGE